MAEARKRSWSRSVPGYREIQYPRNRDGKIDWNTLGNILTGKILGEVLCASYIDPKYGKGSSQSAVDTDWKLDYEEHNIVALRKRIPNSPLYCYMGRAVIDMSMKPVAMFISSTQSAKLWDKYLTEKKEVETLSESDMHRDFIVYMRHEAKQCLVKAKRDFVYYSHSIFENGKYILTVTSVDHPHCPPVPGFIRGLLFPGSGWVLEPFRGDKSKTLISHLAHIDPKQLPPIITNRVLRRYPMTLYYIQQHLLRRRGLQTNSGADHTPALDCDESQSGLQRDDTTVSGRHYEDPLPVVSYTGGRQVGYYRSQSLDDYQLRDFSLSDIAKVLDGPATKEEPAQSVSKHSTSDV